MEIWRDYFLSLYFCFHAYVFRVYSIVVEQAQCASTSFSPVITSQYYIMLEICKCDCAMLSCLVCVQLFATPWTVARQGWDFLCLWDFPGKNTGVGCHALLQGIFPTQGLNPSLPHCRQILNCLSHRGKPKVIVSLHVDTNSVFFEYVYVYPQIIIEEPWAREIIVSQESSTPGMGLLLSQTVKAFPLPSIEQFYWWNMSWEFL